MRLSLKSLMFGSSLLASLAMADIEGPAVVNCTVTKVTPENANFFGFSEGPVIGDTTVLDLAAAEIAKIQFASGAAIGSNRPHPVIKVPLAQPGLGFFEANFVSFANKQNYHARLVAEESPETKVITTSLDVLQRPRYGRLTLHSVELECKR